MDSVSQFALGAAVGQVTIGNAYGRKAALIGGVIATLPDLDSIFLQYLDMVSQFVYHRGVSHSIVFACFGGAFGAYVSTKLFRLKIGFKRWFWCWFLALFTHTLLDCFTSWGTQLFWPLAYRVAFHSVFIIDPFYTVPLLIGIIWTLKTKTLRATYIGLIVSSTYLLWGVGVKQYVNAQFEKGLRQQQIITKRYISRPTPFNSFLWSITADYGDHYYTAYYSIFDDKPPTQFKKSQPKNHRVLSVFSDHRKLQQLLFFTKGFYLVDQNPNHYLIYDARYGLFGDWDPHINGVYIFTYHFDKDTQKFTQYRPQSADMGSLLKSMIRRI